MLANSIAALTATNKKLVDVAAMAASCLQVAGTPLGTGRPPGSGPPKNHFWTHEHTCSKRHMSATCLYKAPGHKKRGNGGKHLGRIHEG